MSTCLFVIVVDDVVTELATEAVLSELLSADDIILMSETIKGVRNKFLKWKEAFESKKFDLDNTKVVVGGSIARDGLLQCNVDPCMVGILKVTANSDLCVQCSTRIHN